MRTNGMTHAARVISMIWAGWWLFFGVASGIAEREGAANLIIHLIMPGGIAVITALIAWRWQAEGAFALLGEGMVLAGLIAMGTLNPATVATAAFVVFTLVVPPLVAGVLFLGGLPEKHRPQPA